MTKLNTKRSNVRRSIDIINSVIDDVAFDSVKTPLYFEYIGRAASLRAEIERWRACTEEIINSLAEVRK